MKESHASLVPQDPGKALLHCSQRVDEVRRQIIISQRKLMLLSLTSVLEDVSDIEEHFMKISEDPDPTGDRISPQQLQFFTKLYEYLISHPLELSTIAKHVYETEDRDTILRFAFSVVPSLFGYFASSEHVDTSHPFFCALISLGNRNLASTFVGPFFNNGSTYRFIENVVSDMTRDFISDISLFDKELSQSVRDRLTKNMLKSLKNRLPLLSSAHLGVLAFMGRSGWYPVKIIRFLISSCIIPAAKTSIRASAMSRFTSAFVSIAINLANTIDSKDAQDILSARPQCDIPHAYADFNDPFRYFLVSPSDAQLLADVTTQAIELPKLLRLLSTRDRSRVKSDLPIWITVYPKLPTAPLYTSQWRSVVFTPKSIPPDAEDSAERAEEFEVFLIFQMCLRELESYAIAVEDAVGATMLCACEYVVGERLKRMTLHDVLTSKDGAMFIKAPILVTDRSLQAYSAIRAKRIFNELADKSLRANLEKLSSMWSQLTIAELPEVGMNKVLAAIPQRKGRELFLVTLSRLNALQKVPFRHRFFLLTECVRDLRMLNNWLDLDLPLVKSVVKMCNDPSFIQTVLLIGAMMMRDEEMFTKRSKEEIQNWFILEGVVNDFLVLNKETRNLFRSLHDALVELTV